MGDFFSRLAEKTLGIAPLVKPDLAPLFAVSPERDTISQVISTPTVAKSVSAAQPGAKLTFGQPIATKNSPPIETRMFHRDDHPDDESSLSSDRSDVKAIDESSRSVAESDAPLPAVVVRHVPSDQLEPGERVDAPKATDYATLTKIAEGIFADPAVDSKRAARLPKAVTPTVQVTIGRVEVRAMLPSAPAPRIVERKAPARLTLEQYLRARNEGRR